AQVGREDERAPVLGHRILQMLQSDERDPREYSLRRGGHRRAELDEHQTEVAERLAADAAPLPRPHRREGQLEACHGQPAPTPEQEERETTHPAAQPRRRPSRKSCDGGCDGGKNQTDRRRRSRKISTPMGMTESTITTTTTMCT